MKKKIIGTAVLVLGGLVGLACGGGSGVSDSGKPVDVGSASTTAPAAKKAAPKAADFKITLKTIEKQCFGSAGCNITYRVNKVAVPAGLDPGTTYEVSYKITGANDPIEGTVTIQGGKFDDSSITDELAQTKSKNAVLKATATAVEVV